MGSSIKIDVESLRDAVRHGVAETNALGIPPNDLTHLALVVLQLATRIESLERDRDEAKRISKGKLPRATR